MGSRVHGVSRARVHGVFWERMKNSRSVGIFKAKANFEDLKGGEAGRWVDPLAKHQFRGPKQPNLTRSNKLQEKKFGAIFVGIFELGRKTTKSS